MDQLIGVIALGGGALTAWLTAKHQKDVARAKDLRDAAPPCASTCCCTSAARFPSQPTRSYPATTDRGPLSSTSSAGTLRPGPTPSTPRKSGNSGRPPQRPSAISTATALRPGHLRPGEGEDLFVRFTKVID